MMKLPKCSSDSFKREGRRGRDRRSSSHFAWRCFLLLLGQGGRSRRAGPPQDPCKLLLPPHDSCRVSLAANSMTGTFVLKQSLKKMEIKNIQPQGVGNQQIFKRLSSFCSIFLFFYDQLYFQPCFYLGFEISES